MQVGRRREGCRGRGGRGELFLGVDSESAGGRLHVGGGGFHGVLCWGCVCVYVCTVYLFLCVCLPSPPPKNTHTHTDKDKLDLNP